MNEYNDAIQRLEMPERPPGRTISRWTFPIPRKNTPWNYNYIFSNTGNMNIPKYSIPQTLMIINHNQDWIDERTTEINTIITNLQAELVTARTAVDDARTEAYDLLETYLNDQSDENFDAWQEAVKNQQKCNSEVDKIKNQINNYESELDELGYVGVSVFDFYLDEQFTLAQGARKSIAIRAINIEPLEYTCNNEIKTDDIQYVCSSINPWSKDNIVGNISQTFHNIPRMFPWNGQQHISIWFLNSFGKHVSIPCIKGSIELELIIDNENTFGYE